MPNTNGFLDTGSEHGQTGLGIRPPIYAEKTIADAHHSGSSSTTLSTSRTVIGEAGTVQRSGSPAPGTEETGYLVPVIGAEDKRKGDIWRITRLFEPNTFMKLVDQEEHLRCLRDIKSIDLPDTEIDTTSAEMDIHAKLQRVEIKKQIISAKKAFRWYGDSDVGKYSTEIKEKERLFLRGKLPLVLMARDIAILGRELRFLHLRNTKLLLGLHHSRISRLQQIDSLTKKCVDDEMIDMELFLSVNLDLVKRKGQNARRSDKIGRDVINGVELLVDSDKDCLSSSTENFRYWIFLLCSHTGCEFSLNCDFIQITRGI